MDNVVRFEGFKREVSTTTEELKMMNFMFETFIQPQHPVYQALVKLKRFLLIKHSYYVDVMINKITTSPEMKAYIDRRTQILETFRQNKIDEFLTTMPAGIGENRDMIIQDYLSTLEISSNKIPEWGDLLKLDSGLRVMPIVIDVNAIMTFQESDGTFRVEKNLDGEILQTLHPLIIFKGKD